MKPIILLLLIFQSPLKIAWRRWYSAARIVSEAGHPELIPIYEPEKSATLAAVNQARVDLLAALEGI